MAISRFIILVSIIVSGATGNDVVIGILGSSVSIECDLPISDTLIWEDSSGNILAMNGTVSDSVSTKYVVERQNGIREILVIHNLTLEDDMQYRCYDLKNTMTMEVSKLNVLVKPSLMKVSYPKKPVLEGTEVTLVCEADGGKPLPEITWHRIDASGVTTEVDGIVKDAIYANKTGNRRHTLSVKVNKETYMASYVCNISVTVFYQRSLRVDLDVHLMPQQPVISGYNGGFDVGKVLNLECSSTGSIPTATIYWLIDNQRVGEYEFVVIPQDNGTSTVKSFFKRTLSRDFNSSILTCAVTNDVLEKRSLPPKQTHLTLLASYKPMVSATVRNHTAIEGGDVIILCQIEARPPPSPESLTWLHNGLVVNRDMYLMPNGTNVFGLQLNNVNRTETGEYRCRAANRLGASSSDPITLTIFYAPVCSSAGVVKVAAKLGSTVRLHCRMQGLPNNVTLLWRYQMSRDVIETVQAKRDNTNTGNAYGSLDINIMSSSQYSKIGCYGFNEVGQGQKPCEYHIVPTSTPDPPINCSVTSSNTNISVVCAAGFSGGSEQHFIFQQKLQAGYQTLKNSSLPVFALSSYDNLTVRVCSVNTEFSHTASCASDVIVAVQISDNPVTESAHSRRVNATAYIAGGVTACVVLLIIIAIFIVLIRRQQKQRSKSELPTSLQDVMKGSVNKQKNNSKASKWIIAVWETVKSVGQTKGKTSGTTPRVRKREVVININDENDDNDATYQNVEVISSTPYCSLKQNRINKQTTEIDMAILRAASIRYQPKNRTDSEPNVFNASTGVILSPISVHCESSRFSYLDDDINQHETRDDQTEEGTGGGYLTADIVDVLDETKQVILPVRLEYTTGADDTQDDGLVTQNKDYSAGDILEVLSNTQRIETHPESDNVSNALQSCIHTAYFNDTKIQDNSYSNEDISKINVCVPDSCASDTHYDFANTIKTLHEPLFSASVLGKGSMKKAFSLPCRLKKSNIGVKTNSMLDIRTISSDRMIRLPSMIDWFNDRTNPSSFLTEQPEYVKSDTISFSSTKDQSLNLKSNTASSTYSLFTDDGETMCAIDEYTLALTSETNADCCSGETESADELDKEQCKLETNIDDALQTVTDSFECVDSDTENALDLTCLRRNSFLSAISNDKYRYASDRSTNNLFVPDSETEQSYFNEGFDLEDDHKDDGEQETKECVNTKRNSEIDIVAYF